MGKWWWVVAEPLWLAHNHPNSIKKHWITSKYSSMMHGVDHCTQVCLAKSGTKWTSSFWTISQRLISPLSMTSQLKSSSSSRVISLISQSGSTSTRLRRASSSTRHRMQIAQSASLHFRAFRGPSAFSSRRLWPTLISNRHSICWIRLVCLWVRKCWVESLVEDQQHSCNRKVVQHPAAHQNICSATEHLRICSVRYSTHERDCIAWSTLPKQRIQS